MKRLLLVALILLPAQASAQAADPIPVVAAENFYGDIAQQIGGPEIKVTSILSNPEQDPHEFEASPSVGRALANARIIIYNGIDYDPWLEKLVGAAAGSEHKSIVVAELLGKKSGDNPHIWYDPRTMPMLAQSLAETLGTADPAHATDYQKRLTQFQVSLKPIQARIESLHKRFAGTPVTATEPVFGYMLAALGLEVRNQQFQLAVMNNTEPSASEIAAFQDDLKNHKVRMLVYNSQTSSPLAKRMLSIAKAAHVPVVGATETEPPGKNYQDWMLGALDAVDRALSK